MHTTRERIYNWLNLPVTARFYWDESESQLELWDRGKKRESRWIVCWTSSGVWYFSMRKCLEIETVIPETGTFDAPHLCHSGTELPKLLEHSTKVYSLYGLPLYMYMPFCGL